MSQKHELPVCIDLLCSHCEACISICPNDVLADVEGKLAFVKPEACTYCAQCEEVCPTGAISVGYAIKWGK